MRPTTTNSAAIAGGAVVLALLFVVLNAAAPSVLADLTVEDGVVEYLTAGAFLLAAVAFGIAGLRRTGRTLWAIPLGLACFLVAGEEVSWGQRILGLGTPERLAEINVQGETNLHNIEGIHGMVRALAVVVLVTLFFVLPLLAERWTPLARLNGRVRFPLPPLSAALLILIGIAFMAVPRLLADEISFPLDEVGELFVASAWLVYAYATWAVQRTHSSAVDTRTSQVAASGA